MLGKSQECSLARNSFWGPASPPFPDTHPKGRSSFPGAGSVFSSSQQMPAQPEIVVTSKLWGPGRRGSPKSPSPKGALHPPSDTHITSGLKSREQGCMAEARSTCQRLLPHRARGEIGGNSQGVRTTGLGTTVRGGMRQGSVPNGLGQGSKTLPVPPFYPSSSKPAWKC